MGGRSPPTYRRPAAEAVVFAGDGHLITSVGRGSGGCRAATHDDHRRAPRRGRDASAARVLDRAVARPRSPSTRNGSRPTRSSSSRTSGDGRRPAWPSGCQPAEPPCSVSRPLRSSRWPWGCAIPTSTARSSAPRPGTGYRPPAALPGRLPRTYLVAGTRGTVLPPPTRPGGRTRYARRVERLSWPNGPARTATPSGNTSFR